MNVPYIKHLNEYMKNFFALATQSQCAFQKKKHIYFVNNQIKSNLLLSCNTRKFV